MNKVLSFATIVFVVLFWAGCGSDDDAHGAAGGPGKSPRFNETFPGVAGIVGQVDPGQDTTNPVDVPWTDDDSSNNSDGGSSGSDSGHAVADGDSSSDGGTVGNPSSDGSTPQEVCLINYGQCVEYAVHKCQYYFDLGLFLDDDCYAKGKAVCDEILAECEHANAPNYWNYINGFKINL